MSEYVGLDVSLEGTSVCILDDSGRVMLERTVVTDPESIARPLLTNAALRGRQRSDDPRQAMVPAQGAYCFNGANRQRR